jgi:hypothetical protein
MFDREHYLDCIAFEYVPDMAVAHFHGRKTPDVGRKLLQKYLAANGALLVKHAWKHPSATRERAAPSCPVKILIHSIWEW